MKILMVSSFLPFPLNSGGHVRLYNLIKELSNHDITLVCEKRAYQTEEDIEEVKKICKKVICVKRKKQWSAENIVKSGISSYPFLMIGHTNKELQNNIVQLLSSETFDLIHIETFYVMQNLPKTDIPTVLVEHNIEYMLYDRYVKGSTYFFRPPLAIDVLKMKYWEEKFWKLATKVVAVSQKEKEIIGRADTEVVPNGVDVKKFKIQKKSKERREKTALFIGDFKWVKNQDALLFLLKDIWPKLHSDFKLWVVGKNLSPKFRKLGDSSVFFDENNKENTEEIFKKADVLLAPIRIGGGTSFKILEAMASGVPVVSTLIGAEGIDATEEREILIGNTAQDLAEKVKMVLADEKLEISITKNARKLIEEKYDWKKIAKKLEEVYVSVLK